MRELRDDQVNGIDGLRWELARLNQNRREAEARGNMAEAQRNLPRVVMQAPTGYGKTVLSAQLVNNVLDNNKRLIFTVPAISLVDQTVRRFYEDGIRDVGVIQANHEMTDWSRPVQVASVQTLQRRPRVPEADLVIIDEVHKWFRFYEDWLTRPEWQKVPFIGLSATPWTKGLGAFFPGFVRPITTQELIDKGRLSDFKVFAPSHPDLTGVRIVAGDYNESDLSARMSNKFLVADIVKTWLEKAERRPTLVFAVDCDHAKLLQEQFTAAGVNAAYQDASTPREERQQIENGFRDRSIEVVVNVGTLTTGVDWDVRCIVLARPTKSEMLFVQIVGRGLRTADGKDHCLILDHSDNHLRLGFVTDIDASHNKLNDGKTKETASEDIQVRLPKECPQCGFLKRARMAKCPACGFVAERIGPLEGVEVKSGKLEELKQAKKDGRTYTLEEKNVVLGELKRYALDKGYKEGWALNKYREKFGVWPVTKNVAPADQISVETSSWITSRNIAWAKSKRRTDAQREKQAA